MSIYKGLRFTSKSQMLYCFHALKNKLCFQVLWQTDKNIAFKFFFFLKPYIKKGNIKN